MKNFLVISLLFVFFSNCSNLLAPNERKIVFDSGKTVNVFLEEESVDDERVFVVDYRSKEAVRKEKTVEDEVRQIWSSVREEADRGGFSNALIKYRNPVSNDTNANNKPYDGLLFEAEKIENGTWKLRKVN